MAVEMLTNQEFDEKVLKSEKTVLIDFFANWCGPCQMLKPVIEQIASEYPQYQVYEVDTDKEPELAQAFQVMSIPTLVVMKDGQIKNKAMGIQSKPEILSMLQEA